MNTLLTLLIAYIFFPFSVATTQPQPSPTPVVETAVASPSATPKPTATPAPKQEVLAATSDSLITVVNRVRKANGCKRPLVAHSGLNRGAQVRADQIVTDWSHNGYAKTVGKYYRYAQLGENLARQYSNDEEIVQAWLNSPTHKAVLLDCRYIHTGVGRNGSNVAMEYGR